MNKDMKAAYRKRGVVFMLIATCSGKQLKIYK